MGAGAVTDLLLPWIATGAPPTFVSFLLRPMIETSCSYPSGVFAQGNSKLMAAVSRCTEHHLKPDVSSKRKGRFGGKDFLLTVSSLNARSLLEPGKLLFAAKQFIEMEADVICLQETRLRDTLQLDKVGEYQLCTSPAEPHRGGLMVMVRDRQGIAVVEQKSHSFRVLRVTLRVNCTMVHVLTVHAPTEEDEEEAHLEFQHSLLAAVAEVSGAGKILMGADMNAK
eukprot:2159583-Amphidinium_carterae.1